MTAPASSAQFGAADCDDLDACLAQKGVGIRVPVVGNDNARFEGNCVSRSGRQVRVRLNGTYQPEEFSFRGGASIKAAGIWSPYIPATITARRLAAQCPANAEYF